LWLVVAGVLVGVVVLGGLVIFVFGEDLFGSDDGTIDSYNREVLESCEVPADSTLVRTFVLPDVDSAGNRVRTMSYVWASPQTGDEVAAFYDIDGPGIWMFASAARSCMFDQRPSVLVLDLWSPDQAEPLDPATQTSGPPADADDEFWAGPESEVTDIAPPPGDTRSFVRLRLGQRLVEGVFGLGADDTAPARASS
jgi:hypothetical protein